MTATVRLALVALLVQAAILLTGLSIYPAVVTCDVGFPTVAATARCVAWVALTGEDR